MNGSAHNSGRYALLSNAQMYEIDDKAIAAGVSGTDLMERAGRAVADAICARMQAGKVIVLCGHGNNGGDGFVIARLLRDSGWQVRIALLGDKSEITGDAVMAAGKWEADFEPLTAACIEDDTAEDVDCIVDALLGAGLTRPVDGLLAEVIAAVNGHDAFTVAVDIPSGISGNTGQVMGDAVSADLTVTFFQKKKGHALAPGRFYCGELIVADIRIPSRLLDEIEPGLYENTPGLWIEALETLSPVDRGMAHKYDRGHLLVVGGGVGKSGAARMAARAGLRAGAGLVTTAAPKAALMEYAAHQTAVMNGAFSDHDEFVELLASKKVRAVVLGPNNGIGDETRARVLATLATGVGVVLDADALTSFEDDADALFKATSGREAATVLTPHGGEFARLFPDIDANSSPSGDKVAAAGEAARRSGAVVVLKGPDTVITDGSSVAIVNSHASPWLATAGAGDVLAGMIGGLLAQGIAPKEAAAAATWLLGEAALQLGYGLIAEDLVETIPDAFAAMLEMASEEAENADEFGASAGAPNETIKALLANS